MVPWGNEKRGARRGSLHTVTRSLLVLLSLFVTAMALWRIVEHAARTAALQDPLRLTSKPVPTRPPPLRYFPREQKNAWSLAAERADHLAIHSTRPTTPSPAPHELGVNTSAAAGHISRRISYKNARAVLVEELVDALTNKSRTPSSESIFVSVASYRDDECLNTVVDMYDKAARPDLLFIGLVDQRVMGRGLYGPAATPGNLPDEPCFDIQRDCTAPLAPHAASSLCRFATGVRVMHVPHYMAKGPTFGRFAAAMLRRNETYYMMIDSHNRFAANWDSIARSQHALLTRRGVRKPVLSHYPEGWHGPSNDSVAPGDAHATTTYLCKASFLQTGIPRLAGLVVPVMPDKRPRPQPWGAAGFLFAASTLVDEVPFDPHLDYLFDGEEILYSVRMWTHGWNLYSPGENILFHFYERRSAKKVFTDSRGWTAPQLHSIHRVQHILQLHPVRADFNSHARVVGVPSPEPGSRVYKELDRYGLGNARTLAAYWRFAGGDPVNRKFTKDWCGLHLQG
jgi:UDP-GlcNAc:polypeptide alpha-N-acetylglucosaminyltransferase